MTRDRKMERVRVEVCLYKRSVVEGRGRVHRYGEIGETSRKGGERPQVPISK